MSITELDLILESTSLGECVRRLREFRGMSLRALAERVGVSAPFLSDLEHGRRNTNKLAPLAEALGVRLEHLERFDSKVPYEVVQFLRRNPLVVKMVLALMRLEDADGLGALMQPARALKEDRDAE